MLFPSSNTDLSIFGLLRIYDLVYVDLIVLALLVNLD